LAEAGAAVAVNYASSKVKVDRIVGNILRAGGNAVAIQADVSKCVDAERLSAQTVATLGGQGSFAPGTTETEGPGWPESRVKPRKTSLLLRRWGDWGSDDIAGVAVFLVDAGEAGWGPFQA
jgi:hypothetical protein